MVSEHKGVNTGKTDVTVSYLDFNFLDSGQTFRKVQYGKTCQFSQKTNFAV